MAYPKVDPDDERPTQTLSLRVSPSDFQHLRALARAEDRPVRAQARFLLRKQLHLSVSEPTHSERGR